MSSFLLSTAAPLAVFAALAAPLPNTPSSSTDPLPIRVLVRSTECPIWCISQASGAPVTHTWCGFLAQCVTLTRADNGDGANGDAELTGGGDGTCTTCTTCATHTQTVTVTYSPGCGATCCPADTNGKARVEHNAGHSFIFDLGVPMNTYSFTTQQEYPLCTEDIEDSVTVKCEVTGALLRSMTIRWSCPCDITQ
jgi:hypothetical protein